MGSCEALFLRRNPIVTCHYNNIIMQKKLVEKKYLATFVLVTGLFALWGFANDITNPMVAAFQTVMEISAAKASMIQFAFYGGYFTMAIPAALFIRRYSYKHGILLGLGLYSLGAFLFIPAAAYQEFTFFCLSLYILTFGLAFLETTANPFILSLGDKATSTRRLNLAQAFNPVGSLMGMLVASQIVLPALLSDRRDASGLVLFYGLDAAEKESIRLHDLAVIRDPYVALGLVVLAFFLILLFKKMPAKAATNTPMPLRGTLKRLVQNKVYREGVIAQMFYIGAQIMMWTFIIQYADRLGLDKAEAQRYNVAAMVLFLCGRFAGTFLMRFFNGRALLTVFALCAALLTCGVIFIDGMGGLYCLIAVSTFMSVMFPTIYGIALEDVSETDTTLGAAFLVMAIVGGALMPPLQGLIIDAGEVAGWPAVNASFLLPLLCFVMVLAFGYRAYRLRRA